MDNDRIFPVATWQGYDLYFDEKYNIEYNSMNEDGVIQKQRTTKLFVDMEYQYEFPSFFELLKECIDIPKIKFLMAKYQITNIELAFVKIPSFLDCNRLKLYLPDVSEMNSPIAGDDWKH